MSEFTLIKQAFYRFLPLQDDEWEEFSARLILKKYDKGDFLIREGQVENFIYFLNTGAVRNYFIRDGKEFTVDFQFPGDFVTAYYSLITREPSPVFIELLEAAEIVVISLKFLDEFYHK